MFIFAISAMALLGLFCSARSDAADELQTLQFKASSNPVVNPGKGWVVYGGSPKSHSQDALDVCSSAYTRFSWSQLEPEEGKFNWEPIDKALKEWDAVGKQFGFGVMCESFHTSSKYNTPKWVFDLGVPSIEYDGEKIKGQVALKQWDNPIFLEKLGNFLVAMGKRYDGDPRVSYIDIRSYGQWGEQHLLHLKGSEKLSPDGLKKHIQLHLDAFKKTRLLIPWGEPFYNPVYDWAIEKGVGIRRDGVLGNSNGSELIRCKGKVPSFGEWYSNYERHSRNTGQKYEWGDKLEDRVLDDTVRGAFTYQNLGQYDTKDLFVKEKRPFIDKLTNMMGYHFLLDEAVIPRHIKSGTGFEAVFKWENKGFAFIFIPCTVVAALVDKDGKVVAKCPAAGCHPEKWAPDGKQISESPTLKFSAPSGSYRLAIGLFSEPKRQDPDIRLGIEGETAGNWHILGNLNID
ncbi:MAG: hypothetical protein A2X48_03075 [Lentisphaerae bacterium GWF2_49_21]|nr:MAG: hypothetical protein A2X48_03075 [Lentisphaerae bacterium GWF2_49_21]